MDVKVLLALLAGGLGATGGAVWTAFDADPAVPVAPTEMAGGQAIVTEAVHPALQNPGTTPSMVPEPPPAPPAQPEPSDPSPVPVGPANTSADPAPAATDTLADQAAARARFCTTPGRLCRTFTWEFAGGSFWLVLELDPALYAQYRGEAKPVRLRDTGAGFVAEPAYDIYVSDPRDDAFVGRIAAELKRIAAASAIAEPDHPAFALAFVQHLAYTSDNVTTGFDEYPRFPFESLVDQGGDCEDTAILYASILAAWGLDPVLLSTSDHMGVGVPDTAIGLQANLGEGAARMEANGKSYLYAETTGDGWLVGERPPIVEGKALRPWTLQPTPLFSLLDTKVTGQGTSLLVSTTVTNLGSVSGPATVLGEVTGPDGSVLAANRCFAGDVVPRTQRPCTLSVDLSTVPRGASVRVEVKAWNSGIVHEVLRSTPFVPFP